MREAPTQFEMRENTASPRRPASRPETIASSPHQGGEVGDSATEFSFRGNAASTRAATGKREDSSLLTIQQVAEILHVPVSWVYGRTRKRSTERLPGIRLGKYWRFREDEIHAWVENQRGGRHVT
jgi:excisionase family DNA binding protein